MICILELLWRSCEILDVRRTTENRSVTFWVNIYILASGSHLTHTELLIYRVSRFIFIAFPQIYLTQSFFSAQSQFPRVQWKFMFPWLDFFACLIDSHFRGGGQQGRCRVKGCPCQQEQARARPVAPPKVTVHTGWASVCSESLVNGGKHRYYLQK